MSCLKSGEGLGRGGRTRVPGWRRVKPHNGGGTPPSAASQLSRAIPGNNGPGVPASDSVLVEVLLNLVRIRRFQQCQLQQNPRFRGVEFPRCNSTGLIVINFDIPAH